MVQMQYNLKNQFVDNYNNTNIFVAAFTTSHACEMLYGVLDKLGDQVLGYDTDSCWFVERPGGNTIPTGDSLGELTDELKDKHIVKWTGTGPKSYAYEKSKGDVECKVKGFKLNYANGLKINVNLMEEIIHDPSKTVVIEKKNAITRDAKTKMIVNQDQTKTFSLGYDKRVVQNNFDTLPYGFKKKMDITKSTEGDLLRLKDNLIADIKKLKGKSQKKKVLFAAKTLAKTVFVAGTVTAALFFPPAIVIAALGGAVALVDGGKSTVQNVRGIKKSKVERKQKQTELKDVSEDLIRKRTLRENPMAPPLYPNLEVAKN